MPLPAEVETLDDIPEVARDEYEEVTEGDATKFRRKYEEVSGLKANQSKHLKKIADLTTRLRTFDGIDLAKVREMEGRLAELESEGGGDHKDREQLEKRVRQELAKQIREEEKAKLEGEYKPKLDRVAALEAENATYKLDAKLEKAYLKAGAIPEEVQDLIDLAKLRKHVALDEYGDIVPLDEKGEPSGLTLEQFVEQTKKTRPKNFLPTSTTGSGAVNSTRVSGGNVVISKADGRDAQKYRAAKEEAKKRGGQVVFADA